MKYKCIRQMDETDCGAACIATICQYYGSKVDLEFIKRVAFTDKYGTNMLGLFDAALKMGFQAEGLHGNIKDLLESNIRTPYIAHVIIDNRLEHYIVVLEMKESIFTIADPARGIYEFTAEEFNDIWTGHILTMAFNGKIKKKYQQKNLFSFLILTRKYSRKFLLIALLSVGIVILNISTSFFFNFFIDNIIPNKLSIQLISISFFLIFIHVWIAVLDIFRSKIISLLAKYINDDIMNKYVFKALHIPYKYYVKYTTGDMVSRLQDADIIRESISQIVITVLLDFLMMILGLYVLLSVHVKLFIVSIFVLIGYAVTISLFNRLIYNISIELRRKESVMTSQFIESINSVEVIKSYNAEESICKKVSDKIESFIETYSKGMFVFSKQSIFSNMIMNIGQAAVMLIGGIGVINLEISLGTLVMFYSLFFMCISPVKNIIDLLPLIHKGEVSARRLKEIYDMEQENFGAKNQDEISLLGDIEINNITFRHGNRHAILDNCSLYIEKGEKVALIGSCGSGKSTLARLLLRLYIPENGCIKTNGYDIADIPIPQLRRKIAYIPQNNFLFQGSIIENIKINDSSIEDNEVISFFNNTPIEKYIEQFPAGYYTFLSEGGNNISGGQRQIIAFARALFKHSDIFILDEATSAVDVSIRQVIEETMQYIKRKVTVIVITHQLNTIKSYDKIYKIEEGKATRIDIFANKNGLNEQ